MLAVLLAVLVAMALGVVVVPVSVALEVQAATMVAFQVQPSGDSRRRTLAVSSWVPA